VIGAGQSHPAARRISFGVIAAKAGTQGPT
jgi:hypothetical protein